MCFVDIICTKFEIAWWLLEQIYRYIKRDSKTFWIINFQIKSKVQKDLVTRGKSRTAATSKMECFVIIINGWELLTIITKRSILDAAADPPRSGSGFTA